MSTCGHGEQSKILVFATENNPLAARISIALTDVGFDVAALTRSGHPVREGRKISHHFSYLSLFGLKSIVRAIDRWAPDLVVCTDDLAVRQLQDLHSRTAISDSGAERRICDLIELSLGPPASFPVMRNKSSFLALAKLEGLRRPKTIVIAASRGFEAMPAELTYPVVVKADHSDGGRCVRIVDGDADLRSVVWELQIPNTWRGRRLFGAVLGSEALSRFKLPLRRTISLQEYISGRPGNRAVICWKGKVLAGLTVEVVEVTHERGPASVVRPIDHPEIAAISGRMVERLHLSGFVGFDFIIDPANRAWLLEMNPRVTQICHFCLSDGTDLAGVLYTVMKRQPPHPRPASINRDLVALFPNEIIRSSSSSYLLSCQHDVPWEEPEIVRYVLNRMRRNQVRKQARSLVEYYLPAVVRGLVRIGLLEGHAASDCPVYFKGMAAPWEGIIPPL